MTSGSLEQQHWQGYPQSDLPSSKINTPRSFSLRSSFHPSYNSSATVFLHPFSSLHKVFSIHSQPRRSYNHILTNEEKEEKTETKNDRDMTDPKYGYTSNNRLILLRCQRLIYTLNPFRSLRGGRGHGPGRRWGALRWHGSLDRLGGS